MSTLAVVFSLAFTGHPAKLERPSCWRRTCVRRVTRRHAHRRWRRTVDRYGRGLLHARGACESDSSGGYALTTTGNGYWFRYQLNLQAWAGSGGRIRSGRPVGVWSMQPEPLEQDYRAVRWDQISGGDPWPNCP